ncbi:MAG: hypothetical protein Q6K99_07380 [Thermostichales cyanobacterium BF4_bins_65]
MLLTTPLKVGILDHTSPIRTRLTLRLLATNPELAESPAVLEKLISLVAECRDPLLVRQTLGILRTVSHPALQPSLLTVLPQIRDPLNAYLALQIGQGLTQTHRWLYQPLASMGEDLGRVIVCEHSQGLTIHWQVRAPHKLDAQLLEDDQCYFLLSGATLSGIRHTRLVAGPARFRVRLNQQPWQLWFPLSQAPLEGTLDEHQAD